MLIIKIARCLWEIGLNEMKTQSVVFTVHSKLNVFILIYFIYLIIKAKGHEGHLPRSNIHTM